MPYGSRLTSPRAEFSARHYRAIADLIRSLASDLAPYEHDALCTIATRVADLFARDNGAFNRDRFIAACGVTEMERGR